MQKIKAFSKKDESAFFPSRYKSLSLNSFFTLIFYAGKIMFIYNFKICAMVKSMFKITRYSSKDHIIKVPLNQKY